MNAKFTLTTILNTVCDYYQLSVSEIKSKNRKTHLNKARKMFYYISNEFSKSTLQQKADMIGIRHETVLHHINDIKILKDLYPDIKKDIEAITVKLFTEKTIIVVDIDLLKLTENYSKLFN